MGCFSKEVKRMPSKSPKQKKEKGIAVDKGKGETFMGFDLSVKREREVIVCLPIVVISFVLAEILAIIAYGCYSSNFSIYNALMATAIYYAGVMTLSGLYMTRISYCCLGGIFSEDKKSSKSSISQEGKKVDVKVQK